MLKCIIKGEEYPEGITRVGNVVNNILIVVVVVVVV